MPQKSKARKLAEAIVSDVFRNGQGIEADRLVLVDESDRDLGGWGESRSPIVSRS